MERLPRWIALPINLAMWLACLVGFVMMMQITADVAGRVIFNHPLPDTIEIVSAYYMVMVAFLPLAYIAATEGHIVVELFTRGLSPRGLMRLEFFVNVVTFVYMTVLTWRMGAMAIQQTTIGEMWESSTGYFPIWPSRWMLPIGCGLMALYLLARIVGDMRRATRG